MDGEQREHIEQFFEYAHLPAPLQEVSRPFGDLAKVVLTLPRNPERTVALRKLLEAKDAAVRAKLAKVMAMLLCASMLFGVAGCSKVSDAVKTQVAVGVATLKQTSASFSAAAGGLVAADPNEQAGLARWVVSFQQSLDAEAGGCAALADALTKEHSISSQEVEAIRARAADATMNAAAFRLMLARCKLTDAQAPWAASTQAALSDIASKLTEIGVALSASSKAVPTPAK